MSKRLGYSDDSTALDLEALFDIKINRCWGWFNQQITENIQSIICNFFSTDTEVFLFAINSLENISCERVLYFVTQKEIKPGCNLTVKLSKPLADNLLKNSFGEVSLGRISSERFSLTEIEASILSSFSDALLNMFEQKLTSPDDELTYCESINKDTVNLSYILKFSDDDYGRIDVLIPLAILIKPQELPLPDEKLDLFSYRDLFTEVNIIAGKSKTTLEELRNLEAEDFVVLEKSDSRYMTIKTPKEISFAVDTRDLETIDIINPSGGIEQMKNDEKNNINTWDNLQLEITAEFKKVKMPLGELKQITEGLVIDVAPVVQNEILLHVEGKKIASGELVVVGDRFGVKVSRIFKENTKHSSFEADLEKNDLAKASARDDIDDLSSNSDSESVDEDFDYGDFEIEDEI